MMKRYIAVISILVLIVLVGCKAPEIPPDEEAIPPEEEQPAPIPGEVPEEITEEPEILYVNLTMDKTMTIPDTLNIKIGTTIVWTNLDKSPHNLIIYDMADPDLKDADLIRSENIYQNQTFTYIFDERGTFMVRDIYSSPMRSKITASVVLELEPTGTTIIVE